MRTLAFACLVPALGACNLLDGFEDDGALVNVYLSHHATPANGEFPEYGTEENPRIFTNDQGWKITLTEAYVTVSGVEVVACSGAATNVDLYWGPCAEDFINTPDTNGSGIGAVQVSAANYCSINVRFGPFDFVAAQAGDSDHIVPENEAVDGTTVFLAGRADKAEESVLFEWSTDKVVSVRLDLSTLEGGGPVEVEHNEAYPKELTVGKSYDTFFSGIDFANYSDADMDAAVTASLELDTRAHLGTTAQVGSAAP